MTSKYIRVDPPWLKRTIEAFDKNTGDQIAEYEVNGANLSLLQDIFQVGPDNGLSDQINLLPEHAVRLSPFTKCQFNFRRYDYEIGAYTTDTKQAELDGGINGAIPAPWELSTLWSRSE